MRCEEVAELMQLELDSQLDRFQREALQKHLAVCGECAVFYRRLRQIHAGLENLPKVEPPFSVVDAIMPELDRIDRQRKREKRTALIRKKGFLPAAGAVAAAFLLAVFAFADMNQNGPRDLASHSGSQEQEAGAGAKREMAVTNSEQAAPSAENQAGNAGGTNPSENRNALAIDRETPEKAADSHEAAESGESAGEMMALGKEDEKEAKEERKDTSKAAKPSPPAGQEESGGKMIAMQEKSASSGEKAASSGEKAASRAEKAAPKTEEEVRMMAEAPGNQGVAQEDPQKGTEAGGSKALAIRVMERPTLFKAMKDAESDPFATRLPSPDQKYLAVYTQSDLEVYQESEIVFEWKSSGQTFTNLVWLDAKTLQVSIDSGTGESEWVVNVENGDIVPADSE